MRVELGIVEATIPLSAMYLPQQLIEVSSPRRYLGGGLTCGRPYSPDGSQESAEFLRTKSEGIAESVRTVVFSALVSGNVVCVLPIVCCLSAPPNAGERLPDLYTHSPCTILYACEERTPKNQSPKPYPDYHSQQLYMNV